MPGRFFRFSWVDLSLSAADFRGPCACPFPDGGGQGKGVMMLVMVDLFMKIRSVAQLVKRHIGLTEKRSRKIAEKRGLG